MSTSDQIFIASPLTPAEVAGVVRETVAGATVTTGIDGEVVLSLSLPELGLEAGGDLGASIFHPEPDAAPDEASVVDGYDLWWDLRAWQRRDDHVRRAPDAARVEASRRVFLQVARSAPWPMILVENLSLLVLAHRPGQPVTEFPPGTSTEGAARALWEPFTSVRHTPPA